MTEEQRYAQLEAQKQSTLNNSNNTYNDLLKANTTYSNNYQQYLNDYQTKQNGIYDKQTAYVTDLQNQNKEATQKTYENEAIKSKNAYYNFINPYGAQAEIQAKNGLQNSGYSETTKLGAWNTQQNRTASAKTTLEAAKLQFDNAIKEALLQNDTNKATLALQILKQQQEEALRNFNYTSTTKQSQLSNNQGLDSEYNTRYNTLYSNIQNEKTTAEAIRQWEAEQAYQKQRDAIADEQWRKEYELSKYNASRSSGGTSSSGTSGTSLTDSGSSEKHNSTYTPFLSNGNAINWANNNVYNGGSKTYFTKNQLASILQQGYNAGQISKEDVSKIASSFGF